MIDDLPQCHKSNAFGPNGSLIGIDFVSYGHDSILHLCLPPAFRTPMNSSSGDGGPLRPLSDIPQVMPGYLRHRSTPSRQI